MKTCQKCEDQFNCKELDTALKVSYFVHDVYCHKLGKLIPLFFYKTKAQVEEDEWAHIVAPI